MPASLCQVSHQGDRRDESDEIAGGDLKRAWLNYQARSISDIIANVLRHGTPSLSGRVLWGEFPELLASAFHHRRLSIAVNSATTPLHRIFIN